MTADIGVLCLQARVNVIDQNQSIPPAQGSEPCGRDSLEVNHKRELAISSDTGVIGLYHSGLGRKTQIQMKSGRQSGGGWKFTHPFF